ncbi:Ff.00g065500.m01.CDS01 [Fusarium sp. VM40]|nr:Ff.00g065500.m01.CDS01 [Fusarium sp. VM40]
MNPLSGRSYGFRYVTLINSGKVLNGRFESGMGIAIPDDLLKELEDLKYHTNGPWTVAHTADETEVFNVTVCYISQNLPHKFNVIMSGKPLSSEPRFLTELSSLTVIRNDTSILRQLGVGVSPDNTTGRGTLDLQVRSGPNLWMELDGEVSIQSAYLELWVRLIEFSTLGGWDLAGNIVYKDITTNVIWATHPGHAAMFQRILHETGNLALALQAIMFYIY